MITSIPHFRYYCAGTLLLGLALAVQPRAPRTAAYSGAPAAEAAAQTTSGFLRQTAANQSAESIAAPAIHSLRAGRRLSQPTH